MQNYKTQNTQLEKKNVWDLGLGEQFLNLTPKAKSVKGKIDKSDLIKIQKKFFL